MTYKNLNDLAAAAMDINVKDIEKTRHIGNLINVYFKAYHNPPVGVVGVGVISYAESALSKHQMATPPAAIKAEIDAIAIKRGVTLYKGQSK